jgi:hypothetical protein
MLYACHVATTVMALGVLFRRSRLILFGFSFHLGAGFWGYLFDICEHHTTTWTSVLAHVLPLAVGLFEVRRTGMPKWAPRASCAFLAFSVVYAYFLTPSTMNVNLAHRPFGPVAAYAPGLLMTWISNLAFGFFLIFTSHFMFQKWLDRRGLAK